MHIEPLELLHFARLCVGHRHTSCRLRQDTINTQYALSLVDAIAGNLDISIAFFFIFKFCRGDYSGNTGEDRERIATHHDWHTRRP